MAAPPERPQEKRLKSALVETALFWSAQVLVDRVDKVELALVEFDGGERVVVPFKVLFENETRVELWQNLPFACGCCSFCHCCLIGWGVNSASYGASSQQRVCVEIAESIVDVHFEQHSLVACLENIVIVVVSPIRRTRTCYIAVLGTAREHSIEWSSSSGKRNDIEIEEAWRQKCKGHDLEVQGLTKRILEDGSKIKQEWKLRERNSEKQTERQNVEGYTLTQQTAARRCCNERETVGTG